ncbi:MAG TPA: hypothetical protein VHG29_10460 [Novosphingobium sp.]|nr:hypothetical protein [Novosphingobium sp.]
MNGRRHLGETLAEVAGGALDVGTDAAACVSVTSLELDLPLDIRLLIEAEGPLLIGDLPLFRLRTAFDPPPARLQICWQSVPTEAAA